MFDVYHDSAMLTAYLGDLSKADVRAQDTDDEAAYLNPVAVAILAAASWSLVGAAWYFLSNWVA